MIRKRGSDLETLSRI